MNPMKSNRHSGDVLASFLCCAFIFFYLFIFPMCFLLHMNLFFLILGEPQTYRNYAKMIVNYKNKRQFLHLYILSYIISSFLPVNNSRFSSTGLPEANHTQYGYYQYYSLNRRSIHDILIQKGFQLHIIYVFGKQIHMWHTLEVLKRSNSQSDSQHWVLCVFNSLSKQKNCHSSQCLILKGKVNINIKYLFDSNNHLHPKERHIPWDNPAEHKIDFDFKHSSDCSQVCITNTRVDPILLTNLNGTAKKIWCLLN